MARLAVALALGSFSIGSLAISKPAPVLDLDAVEAALHQVEVAKLSPAQKTVSLHAVNDVEKVVAELRADKKMSKEQRMQKVHGAIQELQGLQSQWELVSVQDILKKVVETPHLSEKQLADAKKVSLDVQGIADGIQSGKLVADARQKKVAFAIQELESMQKEWLKESTSSLQHELDSKKALLKKEEAELKLVRMEKELAEEKMMLKKLIAQKDQAEALKKERAEDAAQAEMVSKLLATAKALAASKASKTSKAAAPASATKSVASTAVAPQPSPVAAIVADLKARQHNVSETIARMTAEEKKKEAELTKSIEAVDKSGPKGSTATISKGQAMLKMLLKKQQRSFLKAKAGREAELKELDEGVRSVEKGDVAALSKLLGKMQKETKSLQAKSKNFLY